MGWPVMGSDLLARSERHRIWKPFAAGCHSVEFRVISVVLSASGNKFEAITGENRFGDGRS